MNIQVLKLLMKVRGLKQSDIARMSGVSRQAVSLWFLQGSKANTFVNIGTENLRLLSEALDIDPGVFFRCVPCIDSFGERQRLTTLFLWDKLYPTLEEFAVALVRRELPAVARLVQVAGLFQASKIAGKWIWRTFVQYKSMIHPVRRRQCEELWKLQHNLGMI